MHTYHSFLSFWYICWLQFFYLSLYLSFSLSWIVYPWHPSVKLLRPETLFVPRHFLPPLLHFMSGSVIRRPVKTSRRTSPNVASIRNAMLSYGLLQYCSTHCHSQSEMGISMWDTHELSLHDHIEVLLQHARIQLFYTLFHHFCSSYTYRSHTGACLWCTTRFKGGVSWLPQFSSSANYVQRWTLVFLLWDTFFMGWSWKHSMLELCKRSEIP